MTEHAASVVAHGLRKAYADRDVLAGVDLEVPAGTITAVLGPSGCGKTTLLRILAGFEEPDAGTVQIGGQLVAGGASTVPVHRRRVGLMPQEGALFPHLSVGENIAFGISGSPREEVRRRVEHWLSVVGLQGRAGARPHQLSGGQQQRVALARALAAQPRVLLLDEPFAALDAGLRVRVREDIAAILRDTGTTALLVTHDQSEALSLADSVALLIDGTIAQHGTPTDLYDRPTTLTIARFVGATIEIPGTAENQRVHTALGPLRARLPLADGAALAVLRPEQLRLGHDPAAAPATVTASRFYGAETVLDARLSDGTPIALRCAGRPDLPAGAAITVEVVDDDGGGVLAYPSPAGGQRVPLGETRR
ncbi:ABC transporter ATP-binding protein [Mycolicibacterium duvalii]|uniref:ABC-type quaternary amine transporter n=1 Tax=Mycolicibacterium duvalii TaxID=39688 RepID=A0A7I7JX21_9MYCO|nr:ABC transporter ATP-binding protein [Mycolicibacterium duvalii]MCV7369690.1 ABC transporter ATP-binding protein [Mycolicibacterium duvalii]PEG38021.1 ABC transporter ATP-binding protein [Mycolicibacterium duvalii]BBX16417.1 ABC transporter [Mycolicibacterium duvalii]